MVLRQTVAGNEVKINKIPPTPFTSFHLSSPPETTVSNYTSFPSFGQTVAGNILTPPTPPPFYVYISHIPETTVCTWGRRGKIFIWHPIPRSPLPHLRGDIVAIKMRKILKLGVLVTIIVLPTPLFQINDLEDGFSWYEVREILKNKFNCIIVVHNQKYYPINKTLIEEFLKEDKTNEHEYDKVRWNCKDFSRTLLMNITRKWKHAAVGVIIYPRYNHFPFHAVNFFIDEHKMIYCIEPMTDNIFWKLSGKPIIIFI